MRLFLLVAATACGILTSTFARAAVVLRLDAVGPTTVTSGTTVELKLFLDDDSGTLSGEGLFSAGARLLSAITSTASSELANAIPNAGFDDLFIPPFIYPLPNAFPSVAPTGYQNIGGFLATTDIFSSPVGIGTDSVDLGHFLVTVTGNPGDVAIFAPWTLDNDPAIYIKGPDVFETETSPYTPGTLFEPLITSQIGLTITIAGEPTPASGEVPEPTSLLIMLGMVSLGGAIANRRSASRSKSG